LVAAAIFNLDGEQWRAGDVDRAKTMARVHGSGGVEARTMARMTVRRRTRARTAEQVDGAASHEGEARTAARRSTMARTTEQVDGAASHESEARTA
jgi:hypothetical protein